jgi:asparagine synthase (glutamine-hydrolysing)
MCGLAAILSYEGAPVDGEELLRIREAMIPRGPDGAGLWLSRDGGIGLAHRRLAIIDLTENGAQPMATPDGRLRIVFNGEIYNFRELRERLLAKGHRFRSDSDTEVLLYAWREYGQAMVEHLRGMFAFALWDDECRGLFLARDHFGIKPLYYHDDGKTFRVASQVKALLAGGGIEAQIEPAGHVGFHLWGCVPEPYTVYRNLFALPAGHTLWVDHCGPKVARKYFDIAEELENAAATNVEHTAAETLKEALRDSVRHHLIADVPVGVFLSSGLDSATVTALASEHKLGQSIRAITLGFGEFENTAADEVPMARAIAAHYGCRHQVSRITHRDFEEDLVGILHAMDQPSIDGVNTWFVAREAKRAGLKVALSGLGGDELLGGYPSFRQIPELVRHVRPLSLIPGLGKALRMASAPILKRNTSPKYASLFEYGGTYGGAYLLRRGLFMPWELPEFLDGDLVREGWATLQPVLRLDEWTARVKSPYAKVVAMEMACYMRNMLLRDSDWAGMAHSLEIRLPLVDVSVFKTLAPSLVSTIPLVKRDLMFVPRLTLPDAVLHRPKTGFSIPVRDWIETLGQDAGQRGLRGWCRWVQRFVVDTQTN